jgi:hypothetical protein
MKKHRKIYLMFKKLHLLKVTTKILLLKIFRFLDLKCASTKDYLFRDEDQFELCSKTRFQPRNVHSCLRYKIKRVDILYGNNYLFFLKTIKTH